jgi:hypothetical protein
LGALEGMSTCGMSVEEARRVVAARNGIPLGAPQVAPAPQIAPMPQAHHRNHRKRPRHRAAHQRRAVAN